MKEQPKRKRVKKKTPTPAQDNMSKIQSLLGLDKPGKGSEPIVIVGGEVDEGTNEAIKHALARYFPKALEQFKTQRMMENDLKHLESLIGEYLRNFIVLGYDLGGEKIQIFHASNHADADALLEHARGAFLKMLMNSQQGLLGGGNGPI